MNQDRIYQHIGEFVVAFQWLEDLYRQIGWFIRDPGSGVWPPTSLRNETTATLVAKVEALHREALPRLRLEPEHEARLRASFRDLAVRTHTLRKRRNRVLHSAYVELKAGGEVVGLLRADIRIGREDDSALGIPEQELLSDKSFEKLIEEIGSVGFDLGMHYRQLLMRMPLSEHRS